MIGDGREGMGGEAPMRIASLLPAATEWICALSLGERLVAVSHECDWPPEIRNRPRVTRSRLDATASSRSIDDQVRALVAAGEPLYALDEEALAAARPELIVTQDQCDVCALPLADVRRCLARRPGLAGTPVVSLNPQGLLDVVADAERLGAALGRPEAGHELARSLSARIAAVRERVAPLAEDERPRVAAIEWTDPLMFSGNWIPEMIVAAGGVPLRTTPGQPSVVVPWSTLLEEDPDRILVMPCGFDLARAKEELQSLAARPGWAELSAVRSGRVWAIDGNAFFNRPGPRIVESLEILAGLLHPDRFAAGAPPDACSRMEPDR